MKKTNRRLDNLKFKKKNKVKRTDTALQTLQKRTLVSFMFDLLKLKLKTCVQVFKTKLAKVFRF